MKKIATAVLAGTMILSLGATALAASPPNNDELASFNIEEKANEAGLTVEEFLEQLQLEFDGGGKKSGRGMMPFGDGENPEGMPEFDGEMGESRPDFAERQADIEASAAELGLTVEEYLENMQAERETQKEAMLLEKATEAGLTVEEYLENMQAERETQKEAMLLEKATEAGLTVEEYLEQIKANRSSGSRQ